MWCGNRVLKEFAIDVQNVTHAKDAYMTDNVEISSNISQQNIRGENKTLVAPSKSGMFNIIIFL